MADNVLPTCDDTLALADGDPWHAANAIDLCQKATTADKKWGVLESKYVRANGTPFNPGLQVGLQDSFGPNVHTQGGKRLLAISSGHARTPSQSGSCGSLECDSNYGGTAPPGFPQDVPGCDGDTSINDDVGFEVKLRSPRTRPGTRSTSSSTRSSTPSTSAPCGTTSSSRWSLLRPRARSTATSRSIARPTRSASTSRSSRSARGVPSARAGSRARASTPGTTPAGRAG